METIKSTWTRNSWSGPSPRKSQKAEITPCFFPPTQNSGSCLHITQLTAAHTSLVRFHAPRSAVQRSDLIVGRRRVYYALHLVQLLHIHTNTVENKHASAYCTIDMRERVKPGNKSGVYSWTLSGRTSMSGWPLKMTDFKNTFSASGLLLE